MVYQYAYGGYGHSDGIADLLSIVNLENKPFQEAKQWLVCKYSDAVQEVK